MRIASRARAPATSAMTRSVFLFELAFAEAENREPGGAQVEVAGVVVLEGDRAPVVGEAVDFHHETLRAPEEVDFPVAELDVDLGWRQAVTAAEIEEVGLEVAARAV